MASNSAPIIIKKVKKGGHGGHHGGAWKVAYADFVTAMMAFFLLLWLLNVTTDVQKRGIADYFQPSIASSSHSGAGGVLGGVSIGQPGAQAIASTAMTLDNTAPTMPDDVQLDEETGRGARPPGEEDNTAAEDSSGAPPKGTTTPKPNEKAESPKFAEPGKPSGEAASGDRMRGMAAQGAATGGSAEEVRQQAEAQKVAHEREEKRFDAAEHALRQAIQDIPELKTVAENLVVDHTPDGLRIQMVDQEKMSMFRSGSTDMAEPARRLMGLVSQVVQRLPNKIAITGHTDSTPYGRALGTSYGNWELSTDRANASRRELINSGVPADRITRVIGSADKDLLVPDQPNSPRNRRISIVLLAQTAPGAPAKGAAAAPPAGAPPRKLAER